MIERQKLLKSLLSKESIVFGVQAFLIWSVLGAVHFLHEVIHEYNPAYLDDLIYGLTVCFLLTTFGLLHLHRKNLILHEQLKELQKLDEIKLLAESIPTLAWVADANGVVTYLNRRWEEYTGVPVAEGLGWKWQKTVHPDDVDHLVKVWTACTFNNEPFKVQYRIRRFDGKYEWHRAKASSVMQNGKVLKYFGTIANVEEYIGNEKIIT